MIDYHSSINRLSLVYHSSITRLSLVYRWDAVIDLSLGMMYGMIEGHIGIGWGKCGEIGGIGDDGGRTRDGWRDGR